MTTVYKFKAYYTDAGVGAVQDPAPTCTVINMADDSKLADAQATTASTNMPGLYSYEYSGNDGLDCVAWFKTTDTGCDVKELASYVSEKITTNLNADVAGVEAKVDIVDTILDDIHGTDLPAVKSDTAAILADTGTDGVVLKAAGLAADAVTEIQSGLALEATLTAIKGAGWTTETLVTLKAYVDEIETRLTAARAGYLDKLNVTGTLAHSDAAATYKADVSGLAPANEYDARMTAIQADLDNPDQYKADVSALATTAHVQEVENKIDAIDVTVNAIPTNPLLDTAYTAPDNAGIAAIQEKTEQLTFTAPNKVDANADVVLSPEAIEDMASAIGEGLTEEIWSSSVRTLTQSSAEIIAAVLGGDVTQIRGNSWVIQLTGVALESTQQFAIKYNTAHPDSAAILFVDSTDGLTVLNGIAQDGDNTSKASLVYDDAILTITVDASITAQLPVGAWQYGIQSIADNGVVVEPYGGSFHVLADVVRAID